MSRKSWFHFSLVGLLWGVPYLFMRIAVREYHPAVIVFSRVFIGALILLPIAIKRNAIKPAIPYFKYIFFYAVCEMVFPWILITSAERKINSGLAGLLVATVPIWASIMAAALSNDRTVFHNKRLFGMIVGFLGLVLIVGLESFSGESNPLAISAVVVAAILYAYATNMITRRAPTVDGVTINSLSMLITAIIYAPFAIINLPTNSVPINATLSIFGLGIFSTAMAFYFFFMLMAEIGPARSSLVTYLNTAFAVFLGVILLNEKFTIGMAFGLPLVLIGSYLASRKTQPIQ